MLIENIITERYINLIGDDPKKDKYKDEVFSILQRSYKDIGGMAGSGTESPDAIKSIPMWKIAVKDGRVVAAILYKDKNGRKAVATGTDGSITGKKVIADIIRQEPKRSYGEKSKAALGFFLKATANPKQYLIKPSEAEKIVRKELTPIKGLEPNQWPIDGKEMQSTLATLEKYPFLMDYGYFRELNGKMAFKVMAGTPNKTVK